MDLLRLTFSISTWTSNPKVRRYKASSDVYWFLYVSFLCCKSEAIWGSSALPLCKLVFFCLRLECFIKYAVFIILVRWLMSAKRAAGDLFVRQSRSSYGKHSSCFHWPYPSLYKHFKGTFQTVPTVKMGE